MAILKSQRYRQIECDECGSTTDEYDEDDFQIMVQTAKEGGWKIDQDGSGAWTHLCPDCRSGGRLAAAQRLFGG